MEIGSEEMSGPVFRRHGLPQGRIRHLVYRRVGGMRNSHCSMTEHVFMFRKIGCDEKRGGHDVSLGCKSMGQPELKRGTLLEGTPHKT